MLIHDRHYSIDDLKGILAFYKSPVGQKVIKEMPSVNQEVIAVAFQWAESKAVASQKKLDAEKQATAKQA